jgi:hypothetical protein
MMQCGAQNAEYDVEVMAICGLTQHLYSAVHILSDV